MHPANPASHSTGISEKSGDRSANITATSPLVVVTAQDILLTGYTDWRGKGLFVLTEYVATDEKVGPRFPLLLTTGRILSQYNVGAQTRRTANVAWHHEDVLDIHPVDAEVRGINDGDEVRLSLTDPLTTLSNRKYLENAIARFISEAETKLLFELARDKTAQGRKALLATVHDLFLVRGDTLTDRERFLMNDILRNLVKDVEELIADIRSTQ